MELEKVVREFLIESGRTEHRFVQALQFGISCLRELNYDVTGSPSIKILTVNDNDTVDLPDDYLNYIRLGFTDGRGEFRELGRNKDIALNRNLNDCGQRGERFDPTQNETGLFPYYTSDYHANHFRNS